MVVEPYREAVEGPRIGAAKVELKCVGFDEVVVTVDVVKEHRVFGEYAEMYVEDFISAIVVSNVERYGWSAMTALSATNLSVFGLYLLHDKLFLR